MATFEKRGYIKEYDANGNLVGKVLKGEAVAPAVEEEEELLFDDLEDE